MQTAVHYKHVPAVISDCTASQPRNLRVHRRTVTVTTMIAGERTQDQRMDRADEPRHQSNLCRCCRHYKLEAAIASMSWRVQWCDVLVIPAGKNRGSLYSLAKRGSQVVSEVTCPVANDWCAGVLVCWCAGVLVMPAGKNRRSLYTLAKRGSQVVSDVTYPVANDWCAGVSEALISNSSRDMSALTQTFRYSPQWLLTEATSLFHTRAKSA
jgi:hypothetical protein